MIAIVICQHLCKMDRWILMKQEHKVHWFVFRYRIVNEAWETTTYQIVNIKEEWLQFSEQDNQDLAGRGGSLLVSNCSISAAEASTVYMFLIFCDTKWEAHIKYFCCVPKQDGCQTDKNFRAYLCYELNKPHFFHRLPSLLERMTDGLWLFGLNFGRYFL